MSAAVVVVEASNTDLTELVDVAAETFPLACPPSVGRENVADFIAANLSYQRFSEYLADPARAVLVARDPQRILGYAILIHGTVDDSDGAAVDRVIPFRPTVELSKLYVVGGQHGTGVSSALMETAIERATAAGAGGMWLGVNQKNERAQRFYLKHGFTITGTRTFQLGAHVEADFVMVRPT